MSPKTIHEAMTDTVWWWEQFAHFTLLGMLPNMLATALAWPIDSTHIPLWLWVVGLQTIPVLVSGIRELIQWPWERPWDTLIDFSFGVAGGWFATPWCVLVLIYGFGVAV